MKLDAYLEQNDISTARFADMIGVSGEAVRRYELGERIPRPEIMVKIMSATQGAVTAMDFYPAQGAAE